MGVGETEINHAFRNYENLYAQGPRVPPRPAHEMFAKTSVTSWPENRIPSSSHFSGRGVGIRISRARQLNFHCSPLFELPIWRYYIETLIQSNSIYRYI